MKFFDRKDEIAELRRIREKSRENAQFTVITMGAWWDRKGENEIDLVCENELTGNMDFYEVKRNISRFDSSALESKVEAFLTKNPDKRDLCGGLAGLSLAEM